MFSREGRTAKVLAVRRRAVFITVVATVLSYGFNAGWMPFVGRSDNYLNLFSSLLVFLELSVVQAIKAGMADENKWAVGVGDGSGGYFGLWVCGRRGVW